MNSGPILYRLVAVLSVIYFVFLDFGIVDAEEVKIGVITDLSGVGAYWGQQTVRGVKLAEQELKGRGINVKILVGDHTFSTKAVLSEAQKMLAIDKADAFYVEFAPACVAASPVLKNAKKLFIGDSAATSILESNPYAFKAYLDYEKGCREIGLYWKAKNIRKAGMIKLNSEFAELCYKGARSVFPDLHVAAYDFSEDLSSQVLTMKNKGVEAIFNTGLEADMINMLKAMSRLKYAVPVAVSEPDGLNKKIITEQNNIPEGTISFGFPAISEQFRSNLKEADRSSSETALEAAALAYTHVVQLAEAVSICGKNRIKCQVERLTNSSKDSVMDFVRWEKRIASYSFTLKEWRKGKLRLVGIFS